MITFLTSFFGAIAWTAALVLWLIFRLEREGRLVGVRRYLFWNMTGWSVVLLVETVYFISLEIPGLEWVRGDVYQGLRKLVVPPVFAYAMVRLIIDLLKTHDWEPPAPGSASS